MMTASPARQPIPFLKRVRIRNYRSISDCDVSLGPLTVFLGFNGKSNFLDAIRLVSDALEYSLAQAVSARGGIGALLFRGPAGAAESFDIRLEVEFPAEDDSGPISARYGFIVAADPTGQRPLLVEKESLGRQLPDGGWEDSSPRWKAGSRLMLSALPLVDDSWVASLDRLLRNLAFYHLETVDLAGLYETESARPVLDRSGRNLGPVLGAIEREDPLGKERLDAYMSAVVPDALGIDERREGRFSTVQARFRAGAGDGAVVFQRESLSEGTLRAAGVLTALFQPDVTAGRIPLVAIEEPETALHPAGVGALYEALDDAARFSQVIVTSQSSDLLDNEYVRLDHILAVANVNGVTHVGEVDEGGRAIVEKGLLSISELHRTGQMRPAVGEPQ